jgi:hypothetical protein
LISNVEHFLKGREGVALLCGWLLAVAVAVNCAELIYSRYDVSSRGPLAWSVLRSFHRRAQANGALGRFLDKLYADRFVVASYILSLLSAASLAVIRGRALAVPIALILICHVGLHDRNRYGFDGSDQMRTIICVGLLGYWLSPNSFCEAVSLAFIGLNSAVSYLIAGIAKLISPIWRRGEAVGLIVATESYGGQTSRRLLGRTAASRLLSWSTIAFECFCPLLLLLGPKGYVSFAVLAISFHVGIALVMGLNSFVFAFGAALPALGYVSLGVLQRP